MVDSALTHLNMTPETLAFSLAVVFLAAFVRGYTGFGFSALVVVSLTLVMAPAEVVPITLMLEIIASIHLLPKVWKDIDREPVILLVVGAVIAFPVGIYLLATIPLTPMRVAVYLTCLVAAFAIWKEFSIRSGRNKVWTFAVGLMSGVVNGSVGMGGLIVVIFLLAGAKNAVTIRASMIAFFLIIDMFGTALAGQANLLTSDVLTRTLLFIPPLLLGNHLGHRKFVTTPPESFQRYTLVLLMVLSTAGLIRTFSGV